MFKIEELKYSRKFVVWSICIFVRSTFVSSILLRVSSIPYPKVGQTSGDGNLSCTAPGPQLFESALLVVLSPRAFAFLLMVAF